jgi:general secretion pathway protein B
MSYILDALRKADAQRERDPVRGIHAQPVRLTDGERPRDGDRMGFWMAGAAGLAVLTAAGWYLFRDGGAPSVAPPVARTEVVVAAPAPAPAPAVVVPPAEQPAAAVLPPPVVVAPPIPVQPPVALAPPGPPAVASRPEAPASAPVLTRRQARNARVAAAEVESAAPATQAATMTASSPAAPPAVAPVAGSAPIAGLPADAPKLAISGGVYSANVAQRMLIVNGQVFNEGSEIGTGVVLEEIKPKAAVLKFRGSRYTVTY